MVTTRSASKEKNPEENKQKYKDKFTLITQALIDNLKVRSTVYFDLEEKFEFLVNLNSLNYDEISQSCKKVSSFYSDDLNEECQIAKEYFEFNSPNFCHVSMYSTIKKEDLISTMQNLEIILRIYLSLFCTNVPDERSFSKLKYIKNYLRSTMGEEKLNAFAFLSIEYEILNNLDFNQIVDDFVFAKNRAKAISVTSSSRASSVV